LELIDESLKLEKFRNKSHAVEFSINKTLREEEQKLPGYLSKILQKYVN